MSEWISVDDRLPNDGDLVLVYRDSYKHGDLVWQCWYSKETGFVNAGACFEKKDKITHWRYIDYPPQE